MGGSRQRRELLERCLTSLEMIGGASTCTQKSSSQPGKPVMLGRSPQGPLERQISGPHVDSQAVSADELLRRVASSPAGNPLLRKAGVSELFGGDRSMPSAEDMMRWADEDDKHGVNEEIMRLGLKRAELSSWFFGAPIDAIRPGNICHWIAEYFFSYSSVEDIRKDPDMSKELDDLARRMCDWAHIDTSPENWAENPEVKCMMVNKDALPSSHRPFWVYMVTHVLLPSITRSKLYKLGFKRYRAGAMTYWLRRGSAKDDSGLNLAAENGARPIVFSHGLGVGMLPYMGF